VSLLAACDVSALHSQSCLRDPRWRDLEQLTSHLNDAFGRLGELREASVAEHGRLFRKSVTSLTVRHSECSGAFPTRHLPKT
jgi:hypothetical protein